MDVNVITVGQNSVTMPRSATLAQRRHVREFLTKLATEGDQDNIIVEPAGDCGDVRMEFTGGDGHRFQYVITEDGGTHSEGPVPVTSDDVALQRSVQADVLAAATAGDRDRVMGLLRVLTSEFPGAADGLRAAIQRKRADRPDLEGPAS
jgi:hypothetical protein